MTKFGRVIAAARKKKGWSRETLAAEASALAPPGLTVSEHTITYIERTRCTVRMDDPTEPFPYIIRALGLGGEVVLRAVGL